MNVLGYSLGKERDLINKVKSGDVSEAREALLDLLQDIYTLENSSLPIIKAKLVELVIVISRAAVDVGVESQETLKISTDFIQNISKLTSIPEINLVVVRAVERYLQLIMFNYKIKKHPIVLLVKEQIINNYYQSLSLEKISRAIGFSPYYISHVFKGKEGITVQEYLTHVRVEKAKGLLGDPRYNINEVSEKVGYKGSGYFSKVFQKIEGISPSKFKAQQIYSRKNVSNYDMKVL